MSDESDITPTDRKLYIAFEALNFYAYNPADVLARDCGKIARETIDEIRSMAPSIATADILHLLGRARDVLEMIPPPLSDCYTNGLQPDINAVLGDNPRNKMA